MAMAASAAGTGASAMAAPPVSASARRTMLSTARAFASRGPLSRAALSAAWEGEGGGGAMAGGGGALARRPEPIQFQAVIAPGAPPLPGAWPLESG